VIALYQSHISWLVAKDVTTSHTEQNMQSEDEVDLVCEVW